jgi:hypothetical protein
MESAKKDDNKVDFMLQMTENIFPLFINILSSQPNLWL